ncbi:GntR family transcriptional regulator [Streptomyces hebeiensis]
MSAVKYTIIADDIKKRIKDGEFNHQLPTMKELVNYYKSSLRTLTKSIELLKAEDIVYAVSGQGIYLKEKT